MERARDEALHERRATSQMKGSKVTSGLMDGGGSFTGGDVPDDPEGRSEEAGFESRGWLPPEDRLWRHPSEIARHGLPRSTFPLFDAGSERWQRHRIRRSSLAAGAAGVAAVAAAVAVALVVVDATGTGAGRGAIPAISPNAVTIATSSIANPSHNVMQLVAALRPSLVEIEPTKGSAAHMTGVVLPGGALVVTAASAVAGVSDVDVITADGKRHRGHLVGSDSHSGVAVVSTDGGLTAAPFADEPVGPGDFALVACLCPTSGSSEERRADTAADAALSTVTQVGLGVAPQGGPVLVDAIEAEMPIGRAPWGGVLVDSHGRVIGVLDGVTTGDGADTLGVFVPAPLAQGVAEELAKSRHVNHGWLGVECSDMGPSGATVTRVMPGSPAASAGLRPGDVVVAVGSHPVGSLAELQERLYTVPPGDPVQLSVARGAGNVVMSVTLADSPGS
jgi:S1-C subfamily serine protease